MALLLFLLKESGEMSDELYSIYKILEDAFSNHHFSERQYWSVLALLYPEMSDRQLARAMSRFTGGDYHQIYNDIAKASALDYTGEKEFEAIKEAFIRHGFLQQPNESR